MIFLWILLAVIFLVLLLLFSDIRVIFSFDHSENFTKSKVSIRFLFLSFNGNKIMQRLFMKDEKEVKTEEKKIEEAPAKAEKEIKKKGSVFDFLDFISLITRVVAKAAKRLVSKLRIRLYYLDASFGTEEASTTALCYGAVIQACNALFCLLERFSNFRYDPERVTICPDFTSAKTKLSVKIRLKIRPIHLISIFLKAYLSFIEGEKHDE